MSLALWTYFTREPTPGFRVPGQEGGLRNIAGARRFAAADDLHAWFRAHLAAGDKCGILRPEAKAENWQETVG